MYIKLKKQTLNAGICVVSETISVYSKGKKKHQKQTKNHPNLSRFLTDNIHSTCWFSGFCLFVCFKENQ